MWLAPLDSSLSHHAFYSSICYDFLKLLCTNYKPYTHLASKIPGSIVDISSSEIIFNILICRNFKGEIFGELSNSDAITANMQSCDDKLATGEHDLYCTTKAADYCYVFDGTDDGSVVLDDFGPLLEVAIAFKALVLFGVCVYTFSALFAIIDLHYFSTNKVYIEDEGAEMQWVSREEKMDNSSVNSKRNKSPSKPVSNAELLGY